MYVSCNENWKLGYLLWNNLFKIHSYHPYRSLAQKISVQMEMPTLTHTIACNHNQQIQKPLSICTPIGNVFHTFIRDINLITFHSMHEDLYNKSLSILLSVCVCCIFFWYWKLAKLNACHGVCVCMFLSVSLLFVSILTDPKCKTFHHFSVRFDKIIIEIVSHDFKASMLWLRSCSLWKICSIEFICRLVYHTQNVRFKKFQTYFLTMCCYAFWSRCFVYKTM